MLVLPSFNICAGKAINIYSFLAITIIHNKMRWFKYGKTMRSTWWQDFLLSECPPFPSKAIKDDKHRVNTKKSPIVESSWMIPLFRPYSWRSLRQASDNIKCYLKSTSGYAKQQIIHTHKDLAGITMLRRSSYTPLEPKWMFTNALLATSILGLIFSEIPHQLNKEMHTFRK